ncbi:hypothetical protein ABPG72_020538 [Tetrahymena utriculariae]
MQDIRIVDTHDNHSSDYIVILVQNSANDINNKKDTHYMIPIIDENSSKKLMKFCYKPLLQYYSSDNHKIIQDTLYIRKFIAMYFSPITNYSGIIKKDMTVALNFISFYNFQQTFT